MAQLGEALLGVSLLQVDATDLTALSVQEKLARYLLNVEHPQGREKARWFREALGFTRSNASELARQIVFDESMAAQTEVTSYGTKFNQKITLRGANGRRIDVVFGWIRTKEDNVVRLVTAIPRKRQE